MGPKLEKKDNIFNKVYRGVLRTTKSFSETQSQVLHSEPMGAEAKDLCLFAHYSENSEIDSSTLHYINSLHQMGFAVAFVSTANQLDPQAVEGLRKKCFLIIQRENVGFDFGSWSQAFRYLSRELAIPLNQFSKLLLANSSVLGPLNSLEPIFSKMSESNYDLWGLTENQQGRPHLQSYFLVFEKEALRSGFVDKFLDNVKLFYRKQKVIDQYEKKLSHLAKKAGLSVGCYIDSAQVKQNFSDRFTHEEWTQNLTISCWDVLIESYAFPFLKKEVVFKNPKGVKKYADPSQFLDL